MMADKLDLVLQKLIAVENKLDYLIGAIAEDETEHELLDFDGNSAGFERDQNQEL